MAAWSSPAPARTSQCSFSTSSSTHVQEEQMHEEEQDESSTVAEGTVVGYDDEDAVLSFLHPDGVPVTQSGLPRLLPTETPLRLAQPVRDFATGEVIEGAEVPLHGFAFGQPLRRDILHRVVVWQLAKRRAGTGSAKKRAEVSGSGRKPYKQKGTGRARRGTMRGPFHRGGGKSTGPVPRDFEYSLPKKVRQRGLAVALSSKLQEGNLIVLNHAHMEEVKTRMLEARMENFGIVESSLFIDAKQKVEPNFFLSSRNLPDVNVLPVIGANVYDIMRHHNLFITLEGIRYLEERLLKVPAAEPFEWEQPRPEPAVRNPDRAVKAKNNMAAQRAKKKISASAEQRRAELRAAQEAELQALQDKLRARQESS